MPVLNRFFHREMKTKIPWRFKLNSPQKMCKKHLQLNCFSCEYWPQSTKQRFWCLFFQSSASWFPSLCCYCCYFFFVFYLFAYWLFSQHFVYFNPLQGVQNSFFLFIYLVTNFSRQWKVFTHDIVYLPFIFLFFLCFRFFSMVFFVFGVDVNLLPFQVELKSKCSFLFHTNIINRKKYNLVIKIVLCWGSQWRTDGLFSELKVFFKASA